MATSQTALDSHTMTPVNTIDTVVVTYEEFKTAWRETVFSDTDDTAVLVVTPPFDAVETAEARVDTDLQDGDAVIDPLDLVSTEWKADPHDIVWCADEYPENEPVFWQEYWSQIRECIRDETFVIERGSCDGLTEFEDMTPHRVTIRVED